MAILVFSPNGTYVTKPTLEAARTSADCAGKTIVVTSALTVAQSSITAAWPDDRALEVKKGGSIASTTGLYQVFVEDEGAITPEQFGAIGDSISHPLSTKFATLADAQVLYPHAVALTDEIDWCAWQAAVNSIYAKNLVYSTLIGQNYAQGKIKASRAYIVNRTITLNLMKIEVEGNISPRTAETQGQGGCSNIRYNGVDGTIDDPVYIFDCLTATELYAAPIGRLPQARGIGVHISKIGFSGKAGSMTGLPSASGFVSAIKFRKGTYCQVVDCTFGGTLFDAIVMTGPQTFMIIERNNFYGVQRDAISALSCKSDFSTTIWIRDNEFGYVGRYPIILDLRGSVEAFPVIRNNSIEHYYASYYVTRPEWWVHGAVCSTSFINCGNMVFADNRFEATTSSNPYQIADVHIVSSVYPAIENSIFHTILFSVSSVAQERTAAGLAYLTARGYTDITDQRNYLAGVTGDAAIGTLGLKLDHIYNLNEILDAGGLGLSTSGSHLISRVNAKKSNIGVINGRVDITNKVISRIGNCNIIDAGMSSLSSFKNAVTIAQPIQFEHINILAGGLKSKQSYLDGVTEITLWEEFNLRFTNYGGTWNGYTGWTLNRLACNNTLPWYYLDTPLFYTMPRDENGAIVGSGYYEAGVITKRKIRYEYTAAPTGGTWSLGDLVYNSAPASSGYIGWVCTVGGTPGTWKTFGAISA